MNKFENLIDDLSADVGLLEHYHSHLIDKVTNVLELLKELAPNLVGLSQEDYESMVIKALEG